ncbi:MAG: 30S ribosomal protein S15 [Pseudomonadota bacterium]|nr:30S ribosomal protein S15 [Pseudomonadota bacterium]
MQTTEIIKKFQLNEQDTGSSQVQIALMSSRISNLTTHFKTHKTDKHSRYGLLKIIKQRQKLLNYLKKRDRKNYYDLIKELNIRDK